MSRRKERDRLFKILFQEYVNPNSNVLDEEESEYIKENFFSIKDSMKSIEDEIISKTERWSYEEVGLIEKVLLILACHELKSLDHRIVANEIIELAKKYGNENSSKFINGILSNLINVKEDKGEK